MPSSGAVGSPTAETLSTGRGYGSRHEPHPRGRDRQGLPARPEPRAARARRRGDPTLRVCGRRCLRRRRTVRPPHLDLPAAPGPPRRHPRGGGLPQGHPHLPGEAAVVRAADRRGEGSPRDPAAAAAPLTAALVEGLVGPVTFAEYMRLALYDPEHGYYATRAPGAGRGSGFHTSPSLGPWFGRLFARAAEGMREALGRPDELTVVEVGAGRGDLAAAALETPSLEG